MVWVHAADLKDWINRFGTEQAHVNKTWAPGISRSRTRPEKKLTLIPRPPFREESGKGCRDFTPQSASPYNPSREKGGMEQGTAMQARQRLAAHIVRLISSHTVIMCLIPRFPFCSINRSNLIGRHSTPLDECLEVYSVAVRGCTQRRKPAGVILIG